MYQYAREKYGVNICNFDVKPACVDLDLFSEKDLKNKDLVQQMNLIDKVVCVYAGKFGGIYLDREVFHFLKIAAMHWGSAFRFLLLSGHSRDEINKLCLETGLDPSIVIMAFVDHRDVPRYMGLADFALTPVKPVPSKRYCSPIKDGEYWALGLPHHGFS